MDGADIVYHLGAQVWQGRGRTAMADMHAANVLGAANIVGADVGAAVLASSVAVYGAWPDNPLPMDEQWPARPNPECPYAQYKRAAEMACAEVAKGPWSVLRLSAVLGAHADARVARSVAGYRLAVPAIRGTGQAVQWLDEDDAVSGLLAAGDALREGRPGVTGQVFNLAPADWLSAADVAGVAGGRVLAVPRGALMGASQLGRALRLTPFGPDRAALINGPLAVATAKAAQVLNWRAERSSAEVLSAALGRDWRQAPVNRPA
jgi:nucleoside-diphosphate-sugar epimerase